MIDAKEILSEELVRQIEETVRTENRRPSEVIEDAWRRYVDEKSWLTLVERGLENAKLLGITEADVDRLITEYRVEKLSR
jgi:metal-responsive CopG/Arc/MetJ family transcriptional regulator